MDNLKKNKIQEYFLKAESAFKYVFLILTLLSFNNIFAGGRLLKILVYITAAFGGVIVLYRVVNLKKYYKYYGLPILIAFAGCYAISSLINRRYGGLGENIQALVWMALQFGVLYATDVTAPREKQNKTFHNLLKFFVSYVALSNIISIIMLLTGFSKTKAVSPNGNLMGYLWGRLWGVYSDPNYGAVMSVAAVLISLYYVLSVKKVWVRILNILNIVLSLLFIAFSNSRTGALCLALSLFVFVYFASERKFAKFKEIAKQAVCVGLAVTVGALSIFTVSATLKLYNAASEKIYEMQENDNPSDNIPDDNTPGPNIIDRTGYQLEEDISNQRFDLWRSGLEIWKKAPVFGTSHRNITNFAVDKAPETHLAKNRFNTTHNAAIDLFVSQGLAGTVIFGVFTLMIIILVCKKMLFTKSEKNRTPENILLLSVIIAFAASGMFVLEILYINSPGSFVFWSSLGMLVRNLKYSEEKLNA